jgi:hypothetical protein
MSWFVSPQEEGLTAGESHSELLCISWSLPVSEFRYLPKRELLLCFGQYRMEDLFGFGIELVGVNEPHTES